MVRQDPRMRPAVPAPSAEVHAAALARCDSLAKPTGALGRLESVGAWLAACQGTCPPRPIDAVRAVVLAGDHGIARHGVSAYPTELTAAMLRLFLSGRAGVSILARQHAVRLRVLDIAVDDDLDDVPADVSAHKIRRSSGAIHREDALSPDEVKRSLTAGREIATEEIAAGAQLLIIGDMGIGNTTPATALVAAGYGLDAEALTGHGTGIDGPQRDHKAEMINQALVRAGARAGDPVERLQSLGSADLAASAGFLIAAAEAGVPVLLDGIMSVAALTAAEDLAPGVRAWCIAGHRSTEPAQQAALDRLGLPPLLDLGMRLGEGTGAIAAVPLIRSAALLLSEMALLSEVAPPGPSPDQPGA